MTHAERAWGWVAHLRDGGTTPWSVWTAPAEPSGTDLPGAQQLELLRRLNELGPVGGDLAERVLEVDPPRRARSGLPLSGGPVPPTGPRPVDPATLTDLELLRLAAVLLAQDLVRRPVPAARRGLTRPWRIRYHLAGDPEQALALRRHLVRHGRPPGGYGGRTVVLGDDTGQMMVHLWTAHCLRNGAMPWERWWRTVEQRRGLPRPLDVFEVAEEAARQPAPGRVHIVTEPALALRLLGMRGPTPRPPVLAAHAVELGRRICASMRPLAVAEERHRRVAELLRPVLAREQGPALVVPAARRDWVGREAADVRRRVASGRYAVHGDPAALLPAERPGVEAPDADAAFALATRLLVSRSLSAERPEEES